MSAKDPPIFFYKAEDGEYGWLCQWYVSPFKGGDDNIVFKHAEQYMMYQKALYFSDRETAQEILLTTSPRKCKALGRQVVGYDHAVWDERKVRVVEEGSYYKFTNCVDPEQRNELKQKLLETGERELVEASQFDRVWGIGFSVEQAKQGKKGNCGRENWGQNLLGKALVVARRKIREELEIERERKENA